MPSGGAQHNTSFQLPTRTHRPGPGLSLDEPGGGGSLARFVDGGPHGSTVNLCSRGSRNNNNNDYYDDEDEDELDDGDEGQNSISKRDYFVNYYKFE